MMNRDIQTQLGRVWLGEIPEKYSYEVGEILEKRFPAQVISQAQPKTVGVRIVRQGGASKYGVLGASFTPDTSGELLIQIALSKSAATTYNTGWAGLTVRTNADAALDEAVLLAQQANFPGSGILRFDHAAEHPVDSAPIVYRWLVRVIVALLDPAKSDVSDDEIEIILGQSIWPDMPPDDIRVMLAKRKELWNKSLKADG